MKLLAACLGVFALGLSTAGCAAPVDGSDGDEHAGAAEQAQLEPENMAYTLTQSAHRVASAWAGKTEAGATVEYWASNDAYAASEGRSITGASQSCAEWKRDVCGDSWTGAKIYRAVYTVTALDCALPPGPCEPGVECTLPPGPCAQGVECTLPPGPCTPSADAVSFLANGSYQVQDASERAFAWTYVSGSCEYWAMSHDISTGTSRQMAAQSSWSSLGEFQRAVCEGTTETLRWYSVYYEQISCSAISC